MTTKQHLIQLMTKLNYNQDFIDYTKTLDLNFEDNQNPYDDLNQIKNTNDEDRLHQSLQALIAMHDTYQSLSVPFDIFKASAQDFNYRAMKYYNQHQKWGIPTKEIKWLNLLFKTQIFKIHTLRFQIFPMDYQEMERDGKDRLNLSPKIKERFYEHRPLINTHIETNTNLNDKAVQTSLIQAKDFFNTYFPDFKPEGFITRTWLIHPSLDRLLSPESNIIKFKDRFEIIGTSNNYYQALNRIYGTTDILKIQTMPKTSSLQKKAYKIYQDLGVGIGFIDIRKIGTHE